MLEVQKYLLILQNFMKDADSDTLIEFLKNKAREHNLDVTVESSLVFQYQLELE
jgi:predicted amino acid-binding ACT domain protein